MQVSGGLLGAAIGYVLFYNFPLFLDNALFIPRVWDGGVMSFHGRLIGVLPGDDYFRRARRSFFQVSDFIAPLIPVRRAPGDAEQHQRW